MTLSSRVSTPDFQQVANGIYGIFSTAAGDVQYLETKASLSLRAHGPETRLTKFLLPVREALPSSGMDFNQLLQRDLDDHRVATELVPYLLRPSTSGPAFFPPIVAVLLPFDRDVPKDHFDGSSTNSVEEDEIGKWSSTMVGRSFRFDKLLTDEEQVHELKLGRVHWNDECCKLVVVDGQHRAMALLAIHRTLTGSWSGSAEKYKSFYEASVNDALREKSEEERRRICSEVELPVTIAWFPNLRGESSSHQVAARKLFVDVNKNARKPSASRLLLLSDRDLPSIFVRSSLNQFRSGSSFPIFAVEYDHPDSDEQGSSKWSVITNVGILSLCVRRLLMGPPRYFRMDSEISGGREPKSELGDTLRKSLDVLDVLQSMEEEDGVIYKRDDLDANNFPPKRIDTLRKQYLDGWGYLIERMFLDLTPYSVHATALKQLYGGWSTHDAPSRLAKDAIFDGVGVYWTLRDGELHWKALNEDRVNRGEPTAPKSDVIVSWEILTHKQQEFKKIRSKLFLGSDSEEKTKMSESAFEMFKTAACQIGLALAVRTIWNASNGLGFRDIHRFIDAVIRGLNQSINNNRQLVFSKNEEVKKRFNLLEKLEVSKCVYFRYMWVELLATSEAASSFSDASISIDLTPLVDSGRKLYREEIIKNFRKAVTRANPERNDEWLQSEARKLADKAFSDALHRWFGVDKSSYTAWATSIDSHNLGHSSGQDNAMDAHTESSLKDDSSLSLSEEGTDGIFDDEELRRLAFDDKNSRDSGE